MMAQENTEAAPAAENLASTKDDIARLIHSFKEPLAQRHWTDLYSVLTRSKIDARKSGGNYAVPANPLASVAEIFNDYNNCVPQNLMLQYLTSQQGSRPVKNFPFEANSPEWSYLATQHQEIEPTNVLRKKLIGGIESGHQRESKLSALHLSLEFGDATEKLRAMQELHLSNKKIKRTLRKFKRNRIKI
jgi:hypothetical protein